MNAPPAAGALLDGRYHVGAVIARGGMSTVYRGHDTRLDRPVAIKIMDDQLARDPAFRTRFVREARSAARIDHPSVVDVHDQGADRDRLFLVMELVEGATLRDVLRTTGALGVPRAFAVMERVLAGLAAAHAFGLVHRDVKPENVLISTTGEAKVADFGLAVAAAQAGASHVGMIMGTVAYLSPEQVATGAADPRSDVYAAGVMLYELLTGVPPYTGDTAISVAYRHVTNDMPPPSRIATEVPPELDALVLRATRRDPTARPADAGTMLAELHEVGRQLEVPRVPVPPPPPSELVTVPGLGRPGGPERGRLRPGEDDGQVVPPVSPSFPGSDGTRASGGPRTAVSSAGVGDPNVGDTVAEAGPSMIKDPHGATPLDEHGGSGHDGAGAVNDPRRGPVFDDPHRAPAFDGAGRSATAAPGHDGTHVIVGAAHGGTWVAPGGGAVGPGGTRALVRPEDAPQVPPARRPRRRRLVAGIGVVLVLALGIGLTAWWLGNGRLATVPALRGISQNAAERLVTQAGLVARITQAYDNAAASGIVTSSDPGPGARVPRGGTVTLVVSRGRPTVPAITAGTPAADAEATVRAAQLTPTHSSDFSNDIPSGAVIRTDPSGGAALPVGGTVTLVVSEGAPPAPEQVRVPFLVGRRFSEAEAILESLGLKAEERPRFGGFGRDGGVVVGQSAGAGSLVDPGTTIELETL